MPLYTDAYLGDTTHLTTTEHGAYLLLLITMWRTKDGSLPDDDRLLARYTRLTTTQWQRVKLVITPFFTINDGVWTQGRLTDELLAVRQQSKRQSDKVKARWLKNKEKPVPRNYPGNTSPYPIAQEDNSIRKPSTVPIPARSTERGSVPPDDAGIDANGRLTNRGLMVEFPDWMEPDTVIAFASFMEFRKAIKRPILSQYNFNRLIGSLTRLRDEGHDPEAVINQSIERAWEGFYELKADGPKKSFAKRMQDATVAAVMDYEKGKT